MICKAISRPCLVYLPAFLFLVPGHAAAGLVVGSNRNSGNWIKLALGDK